MNIVGQRLMDQLVKTDLLERWSVMKQTEAFKWNFSSLLYEESRWSTCSWDVTGFVYGCLFVCDWHRQMVSASSEALMAIVHHSACVSHRGWARRSPTQVNDQSLQRKWRFMSFGNASLSQVERNESSWKTCPPMSTFHRLQPVGLFVLNDHNSSPICNVRDPLVFHIRQIRELRS